MNFFTPNFKKTPINIAILSLLVKYQGFALNFITIGGKIKAYANFIAKSQFYIKILIRERSYKSMG